MRTFDENLDAYHALNAQNDAYVKSITLRLRGASAEEMNTIRQEADEHFAQQGKLYEELGKEAVKIMDTTDIKWWQFWKW